MKRVITLVDSALVGNDSYLNDATPDHITDDGMTRFMIGRADSMPVIALQRMWACWRILFHTAMVSYLDKKLRRALRRDRSIVR